MADEARLPFVGSTTRRLSIDVGSISIDKRNLGPLPPGKTEVCDENELVPVCGPDGKYGTSQDTWKTFGTTIAVDRFLPGQFLLIGPICSLLVASAASLAGLSPSRHSVHCC